MTSAEELASSQLASKFRYQALMQDHFFAGGDGENVACRVMPPRGVWKHAFTPGGLPLGSKGWN